MRERRTGSAYNSAMLGKKLLTAVCAAGILAIGACFLPSGPQPRVPPPPRLNYGDISRVCVSVEDHSAARGIDPSALAINVAQAFNRNVDTRAISAGADCGKAHNGVLQIEVLEESAGSISDSSFADRWNMAVTLNATLTDRGGAVLWRAENFQFRAPKPQIAGTASDPWSDATANFHMRYWLSSTLVHRLLNNE